MPKMNAQNIRLVRMLEQLQLELNTAEQPLTIRDLVERWLAEHVEAGHLRPASVRNYRRHARDILRLLGDELASEIGPRHVAMILSDPLLNGPSAQGSTCNTFRTIMSWARQQGHFNGPDRLKACPRYTSSTRNRVLTDEELRGIWEGLDAVSAPPPVAGLIRCLLLTGARRCEFRLMRWEQIHPTWSVALLGVVKRSQRRLHLPQLAQQIIEQQPRRGPYVFSLSPLQLDALRRPVSDQSVSRWWNASCKHARIKDASPHAARHTMITRLMRAGYHPAVVRDLAGHSSMAMTFHYTHASPDELTRAGESLTELFRQTK